MTQALCWHKGTHAHRKLCTATVYLYPYQSHTWLFIKAPSLKQLYKKFIRNFKEGGYVLPIAPACICTAVIMLLHIHIYKDNTQHYQNIMLHIHKYRQWLAEIKRQYLPQKCHISGSHSFQESAYTNHKSKVWGVD